MDMSRGHRVMSSPQMARSDFGRKRGNPVSIFFAKSLLPTSVFPFSSPVTTFDSPQ